MSHAIYGQPQFAYLHFYDRSDGRWLGCLNPMTLEQAWEEADRVNNSPQEKSYAKVLADNDRNSQELPRPVR
jgi:hypothetical protein